MASVLAGSASLHVTRLLNPPGIQCFCGLAKGMECREVGVGNRETPRDTTRYFITYVSPVLCFERVVFHFVVEGMSLSHKPSEEGKTLLCMWCV